MLKRYDFWFGTLLSVCLLVCSWQRWLPFSLTETLGFVSGAWCVYLVVKQNIWNFPVGIANNIFFLILFGGARLYGDAGLQLVYLALAAQGWYLWLYGGRDRTTLTVTSASRLMLAVSFLVTVIGTFVLWLLLRTTNSSAPALDALTTTLSLIAQYLLNRKHIENWYVWIAADVIYIYLYVSRGLHLTAVLYLVFLCLCVAGIFSWRKTKLQENIAHV